MQTEELSFYHGTGEAAARAILTSGSRDSLFEEIGARRLGREIWRAILAHWRLSSAEGWKLHYVSDSELSALWVPALRQLDEPNEQSLIEYGHFFTTLNIGNAYRYALNPYRSEFIQVLAEGLKVLNRVGHELPKAVVNRFPDIDQMIRKPSSPVVLELRGVSKDRLLTEQGSADIEGDLLLSRDCLALAGVNAPAAFRVRDVTVRDVVAVHDVSRWSSEEVHDPFWQPDPSKVREVRKMAHEWLALAPDIDPLTSAGSPHLHN